MVSSKYPPLDHKENRIAARGFDSRAIETYVRCIEPKISVTIVSEGDPQDSGITAGDERKADRSLDFQSGNSNESHVPQYSARTLKLLKAVGLDFIVNFSQKSGSGYVDRLVASFVESSAESPRITDQKSGTSGAISFPALANSGRIWVDHWILADLTGGLTKEVRSEIAAHRDHMRTAFQLSLEYEFIERAREEHLPIPVSFLDSRKGLLTESLREMRSDLTYLADIARRGSLTCEMIGYYFPFWQRLWFVQLGGRRGLECWGE